MRIILNLDSDRGIFVPYNYMYQYGSLLNWLINEETGNR